MNHSFPPLTPEVDLQTGQLVCNESGDLVRMLNDFEVAAAAAADDDAPQLGSVDLYPAALADQIDATNKWVYEATTTGERPVLSFSASHQDRLA